MRRTEMLVRGFTVTSRVWRTGLKRDADIIATGPFMTGVPGVVKGIIFKTDMQDIAIVLFNNKVAPYAYSYLSVIKGYGCMCAFVMRDLNKIGECFERTKQMFNSIKAINIEEPQAVGGVGSFSLKGTFKKGKSLTVGEAAGLQDFLWGFGMRYALVSGYLAAQSIIHGWDYPKIAKKHYSHKLKASVVNRFLWEHLGRNDYSFILKNIEFVTNNLYTIHNYHLFQRILYPVALFNLRKKYPQLIS